MALRRRVSGALGSRNLVLTRGRVRLTASTKGGVQPHEMG